MRARATIAAALFFLAACAARRPGSGDALPDVEAEPVLRLVEVRALSDANGLRLVAQMSRPPDSIRTFELEGPRRCVVDADGPATSSAKEVVTTRDPQAPRLSVAGYPDHVRLVLELATPATGGCQARVDGSAVVFGVGARPAGGIQDLLWSATSSPAGASAHAAALLAREAGPALASPPAAPPPRPLPPRAPEPVEPVREARPRPTPAPARAATRRYSGQKVSLEFKDADILNVLRVIADVSRKNIVATDDVAGRVTIVLREVPWDQALDILLRSTGLEKVEYDDVITVSTAKRIEEERRSRLAAQIAGRELESLRTEYIRVNYVKATDLAMVLRGQSVTGTPGSGLNQAGQTQAQNDMTLQAEAAAGQFRGLLSNRGSVQVNDVTNTLIVRDIAEGIANARELVSKLDVQTPQVAIQGLIFEADTSSEVDLGIRWGASYKASPETGNPTGKNFPGRVGIGGAGPSTGADGQPIMVDFPAGGVAAGSGSTLNLLLGSLSGAETIDAQITALEQAGRGKVISRPKVITLNNSEASIESLEIIYVRLPSTGTVINTGQNGSAGSNSVATQPIDTGIILKVRPQVSSDGYVLMDLFVKSSVPSEQKTDDIPNEISRQASSQVLVREGETVVIGGVYRQRAANAMTGVPWLANIPVIGWLFKTTRDFDNRQELLVFITPRVVWRPATPGALPSAAELWSNRSATAYPPGLDVPSSSDASGPRW